MNVIEKTIIRKVMVLSSVQYPGVFVIYMHIYIHVNQYFKRTAVEHHFLMY